VAHQSLRQLNGAKVGKLVNKSTVFFNLKKVTRLDVLVRDPLLVELHERLRHLLEELEHVLAFLIILFAENIFGIILQTPIHLVHYNQQWVFQNERIDYGHTALDVQVHAKPPKFFTLGRDVGCFDQFASYRNFFFIGEIELAFEDCSLSTLSKYFGFKLYRLFKIEFLELCV